MKLKDAGPIPVLERIEKQAAEIQLAREAKLVALERHSSEIPTVNVTFETRIGRRSDLPADDPSTDAKTQA